MMQSERVIPAKCIRGEINKQVIDAFILDELAAIKLIDMKFIKG